MIDPRISLAAQAPNLQSSITLFDNTLNNIQNRKMNQQNMEQSAELQPLRVQAQQQAIDAGQMNMDNARRLQYLQSVTAFDPVLRPLLESGNQMGALQALQQRKDQLIAQGRPTETTDDAINQLMNGNVDTVLGGLDMAKAEYQQMVGQNQLTGQERFRQQLLKDAQSEDETTRNSALVALGTMPRAGSSAQERIATDKGLGEAVVNQAVNETTATATAEQPIKIRGEALSAAQRRSEAAIDTLTSVRSEISNLDNAIQAIDSGAASGKVSNWFPSFKSETIKLRNAASRLGLDVVSATTFGALSEGELKLAMDVAVPTDLQPQELKAWLTERKNARVKLANELEKMAIALGSGEMTSAEYLKQQKENDPLGLGL